MATASKVMATGRPSNQQGVPLEQHQGLANTVFGCRTEDDPDDKRGNREFPFTEKISNDPRDDHDPDVEDRVSDAIDAEQADQADHGDDDRRSNDGDSSKKSDERQIEDQEHQISDIHGRDKRPEDIRTGW